jgi:hypothetical protein
MEWSTVVVLSDSEQLIWNRPHIISHCVCLARSYRHWTGRDLVAGAGDSSALSRLVYEAPSVVVSHGLEEDPVLNYGNRAALALWDVSWVEFTRTPSRLTAEAPDRGERARLLETVARHGFIEDYSGVRISKAGRRFRIERATVWNLLTGDGRRCGQAALFDRWHYL